LCIDADMWVCSFIIKVIKTYADVIFINMYLIKNKASVDDTGNNC